MHYASLLISSSALGQQLQPTPGQDAVGDQEHMGDEKADKNGQKDSDRLLHPAHVHHQQHDHQHQLGAELELTRRRRQQTEQRVYTAGHRDRDGQHIVDHQRRARNQSSTGADETGGHAVSAPAGRKQLDHLVVGKRNNEHRRRGGDRHVQPELGMCAERLERLLRAVRR
jgi:hypothetical protein